MLKPEPSSILVIAIALAALKHKPRDQSTASYVLDLQAKFPLGPHSEYADGRETGTGALSPQPEADKWRAHALELEKELQALKAQRDADQEELVKLRHDASQKRAVDASSDAPPPPKKKTKKNSKEATSNEWKWSQLHADWSSFLDSQYPPPPSVVAAYTSLRGAFVSLTDDKPTYASRLTDAITRTLKILHVFLFSGKESSSNAPSSSNTLAQPLPTAHKNLNSARIAMASPLLMYVLRTCLPALLGAPERPKHACTDAQRKNLDVVLDQLLESVLLPLLRSFVPLSHHHLEPLITLKKTVKDKGKGKEKDAEAENVSTSRFRSSKRLSEDTRTDALTLLGASLSALESLPPPHPSSYPDVAAAVRERLGLETIRELEALYAVPSQPSLQASSQPQEPQLQSNSPPCPTQTSGTVVGDRGRMTRFQKSREERVRALAVKSAGWYLCSVLNLCVPQTGSDGHEGSRSRNQVSVLLMEALVDGVGRLVRSVVNVDADKTDKDVVNADDRPARLEHDRFEVDAVCRGMLLAVCERAMTGVYN